MWFGLFKRRSRPCLRCGGETDEAFEGGQDVCGECGFSVMASSPARLAYKARGGEWRTVERGCLLVASSEADEAEPARGVESNAKAKVMRKGAEG